MNNSNIFNPIHGLSASQIVLLFEQGSAHKLNQNHRILAIASIDEHLSFVPEATLKTTLTALFRVTELRRFASVAFKSFLGESKPEQEQQRKMA